MEAWTIAGVGFGSALLGAGFGFLGSLFLDRRAARDRQRGVIKALLGELLNNTNRAIGAVSLRQFPSPYFTTVWETGMFEIARFTNRHQFAGLIGSYGIIDLANRHSKILTARDEPNSAKIVRAWYEATRRPFNMIISAQRFRDATSEWRLMEPFETEVARAQSTLSDS